MADDLIKRIEALPEGNSVFWSGNGKGAEYICDSEELQALARDLSAAQEKLAAAVKVIEHYAETEHWGDWDDAVYSQVYRGDGFSNGYDLARKYLDDNPSTGEGGEK